MKRNLIRIQQFLLNHKSACRNISNHPLTEGIRCMRTSPRTKSSTLWDNSPANTYLSVPDHPLTGITSTSTGLPQSENLHPLEKSTSRPASRRPVPSTHWRNPPADRLADVYKSPTGRRKTPHANKKKGSRSRSSTGTPNERMRRRATLPHPLECSTIAVPGLSFRVRKGTGRLTWAMTTAKPL